MSSNEVVEVVQEGVQADQQDSHVKPFADQVIDLYESCLQNGLIISTSFQNVIQNKLDKKRRRLQAVFMMTMFAYGLRYSILCLLFHFHFS